MLSAAQNERLTQTSAGTPMGELLRRYWHPIAASVQLNAETPTREVRLLGEDLVLFRSAAGKVGLVEPGCPHRMANLSYGIPEPEGLRCMYHGWLFDEEGNCLDQPSEPEGSRFKEKVKIKAYPVEELGGLIFAYLGPRPAPVLPKWDILVWENVDRNIMWAELPCNWVQCMDNSLDPVHFEWLHRYWGSYMLSKEKPPEERAYWGQRTLAKGRHHLKVGFDRFEHGIIKRRLLEGETEDDAWWRVGHPILFPNILRVGSGRLHIFQIRVPVDDTHTLHFSYGVRVPEAGKVIAQTEVPAEHLNIYDKNGRLRGDDVIYQDQSAWVAQGPVSDRSREHLGVTDVGLIMYRKLIEEQLRIVEDGGEPMNFFRDDTGPILLPQENSYYPGYDEIGGPFTDTLGAKQKPDLEVQLAEKVGVKIFT